MPQAISRVSSLATQAKRSKKEAFLLPTVATERAGERECIHSAPARRVARVVLDLDGLLFREDGWFALGAGNERVPGVVVSSLRDGLRLLGQGPVRAVVGRLRPEVRVVDVDLDGAHGDAAVELLAAWCRERGLWHLVRPSGGGPGRAHVFLAPGPVLEDLCAYVETLRTRLRAGRRGLDVRDTVRPLASPHRNGTATTPYGNLTQALAALRGQSWATLPMKPRARARTGRVTATPAVPARSRARRALPKPWQAWLEHGVLPPLDGDGTRSNHEATATAVLLRAGHDAASAWQAIEGAHPDAFTKARSHGQTWWVKYVWNPAVASDDEFTPTGTGTDPDPGLVRDVTAARESLEQLAWDLTPRQRPALLMVGHTVLDRMLRTGTRRIPVPERDLVLDTGITDRKTIRAQLRRMTGPVGTLHTDCWDPVTRRDSSSFEFEIPPTPGVGEIPPPSFHPPTPHGLWATLPRTCHQLWRTLARSPRALTLPEVTVQGQLTTSRTSAPGLELVRAARASLTALSRAGLAVCAADGTWEATRRVEPAVAEAARVRRRLLEETVAQERDAYRAGASSGWSRARAAAWKAQRAREVAWWGGLDPAERDDRREALCRGWSAMSALEQERVKGELADRRARLGQDEAERHRDWLQSLPDDELTERSTTRSLWFARQPTPLQRALVAAWQRHRDRYGLPRASRAAATRLEQHRLLPVGAHTRDEAFLQEMIPALHAGGTERATGLT